MQFASFEEYSFTCSEPHHCIILHSFCITLCIVDSFHRHLPFSRLNETWLRFPYFPKNPCSPPTRPGVLWVSSCSTHSLVSWKDYSLVFRHFTSSALIMSTGKRAKTFQKTPMIMWRCTYVLINTYSRHWVFIPSITRNTEWCIYKLGTGEEASAPSLCPSV